MNKNLKSQGFLLFFGGILPIIAFTVIEEKYGVLYGLIAGMLFGVIEIIYELIRYKKVSSITWASNGMILALGGISLLLNDGIWFKLQPSILEMLFFAFLFGSWLLKKPILSVLIKKQNPEAPPFIVNEMSSVTLRMSFFMLVHALIALWAAFQWSTEAWALLKGLGLTLSFILYMILEVLLIRAKIKKRGGF